MLSKELEHTLNTAFKEARERRYEFMTVEHLLLALLDNPTATSVLRACGADIESLRRALEQFVEENTPLLDGDDARETQPTLGFQRVLQRAVFHVQSAGSKEVTGANVLVAIFGEQESHAVYLLSEQNISRLDVVNYISHGISKVSGEENEEGEQEQGDSVTESGDSERQPLENFATNLNERALAGQIDPLIGRDNEVERTVQILCRRRKNNPLLVGEAGVGKTAIAEGLAKKVVDGEVPEILSDATIYALDLGALVAGIDAGRSYTDWPTMGGQWFPPNAFYLDPAWRNFFESPGLVQFVHRVVGYVLLAFGIGVWIVGRRSVHRRTRFAFNAVMSALALQVALGIVTVIYGAPWYIAIAHQLLAVVLWVLILRARFLSGYPVASSIREG